MREYLGGVGLGAKILYEEVGPKVHWDHPDNRLVLATGPLAGLPVWGTGGLTVVTRGAQTDGATSTQANGFFGAALKSRAGDCDPGPGGSPTSTSTTTSWIRDAPQGQDTWERRSAGSSTRSRGTGSVCSIGPAGARPLQRSGRLRSRRAG
jgi:aldehyde:ferredoxin oxidoreductase